MGENNDTSILEQMRQGINRARAGDRAGAEAIFDQVLARRPNHEEALVWKAAVVSDPDEAIRHLEQALRVNPENKRARVGLEWAYKRKKGATDPALHTENNISPEILPDITPKPKPATPAPAATPAASPTTFQPGVQREKPAQPNIAREKMAQSTVPREKMTRPAESTSFNETKVEYAPYKKRRLSAEEPKMPPVDLPPEAVRWTQPPRPKTRPIKKTVAPPPDSAVFKAARPTVAFRVAPAVARIYGNARSDSRQPTQPLPLRWPLYCFGLAVGLALLSFPFSEQATLLGVAALTAAVMFVITLSRAEL